MKKFISSCVFSVLVLSVFAFAFGCSPKAGFEHIDDLGDGVSLRVGIISDTQLPSTPNEGGYLYEQHLLRALTYFKERGIDALMFAGDLSDLATEYAYDSFVSVYNYVFGDDAPVNLFVMGNHDYWLRDGVATPVKMQNRFQNKLGESPWSHKVLNGYHFINLSPANGSTDGYASKLKWARQQLDAAVAEDSSKPIFIQTHHNVKDTVYGSDEWGTAQLDELFKEYPQLVSFSGHSHYSLIDERSIYQSTYTAIQTQSLSYIELESGKENGTIPVDAEVNPMGLYMTVKNNKVELERISFADRFDVPQVYGNNWVIDFSLDASERFNYTAARAESRTIPVFNNSVVSLTQKESVNYIEFNAASHDDFVHSYLVEFYDGDNNIIRVPKKVDNVWTYQTQFYYFSDFYKGKDAMSQVVKLKLPQMPAGVYKVKITAIESFGNKSTTNAVGTITIA